MYTFLRVSFAPDRDTEQEISSMGFPRYVTDTVT